MRVVFVATGTGSEAGDVPGWGVTGEGQYLTFRGAPEGTGDGQGVHLEYGHQTASGHGRVAGCRLTRAYLTIGLAGQMGSLTGFDVALDVDDETFAALRAGLQQVFRGHEDSLRIY